MKDSLRLSEKLLHGVKQREDTIISASDVRNDFDCIISLHGVKQPEETIISTPDVRNEFECVISLHGVKQREEKILSAPGVRNDSDCSILRKSQSLNIRILEETNSNDFSGAYDGFKLALEPPSGEYTICETFQVVGLAFLGGAIITFVWVAAPLGLNAPKNYNNFWVYAYFQQYCWDLAAYFMIFTLMEAALPGMPNWLKVTTHLVGIISAPIYRAIFHSLGMDDNLEVNLFCTLACSNIPVFTGFLVHIMFFAKAGSRTGLPVLDVYTGAYWLEMSTQRPTIFRKPGSQYLLVVIFISVWFSVYAALEYFTFHFTDAPASEKPFWYAAFIAINLLYKAVLKGLGIIIDAGKSGTYSLFFYAELMILIYYYSFYRVLFDSLGGSVQRYLVFIGVQVLHVLHEWVFYPLRATQTYYKWYRSAVKGIGEYKSTLLDALFAPLSQKLVFSYKDWASFVTLDYGLRVSVAVFTSITYVTYYTFLRYGWNRYHFKYYYDVDDSTYLNFVLFMICSSLIEIINTWVMEVYFLKPRRLRMTSRLTRLFTNRSFRIASSLLLGTLFCNVFLVNSIMDFVY